MSIEIVTTSGKKIGRISDDSNGKDTIIINDKEISLDDAYASEETRNTFNSKLKEFHENARKD